MWLLNTNSLTNYWFNCQMLTWLANSDLVTDYQIKNWLIDYWLCYILPNQIAIKSLLTWLQITRFRYWILTALLNTDSVTIYIWLLIAISRPPQGALNPGRPQQSTTCATVNSLLFHGCLPTERPMHSRMAQVSTPNAPVHMWHHVPEKHGYHIENIGHKAIMLNVNTDPMFTSIFIVGTKIIATHSTYKVAFSSHPVNHPIIIF